MSSQSNLWILLFLQKVGGGYIFVHRMLLEHFADMEGVGAGGALMSAHVYASRDNRDLLARVSLGTGRLFSDMLGLSFAIYVRSVIAYWTLFIRAIHKNNSFTALRLAPVLYWG